MKTVLVTGSAGFVGRNLVVHLRRREDLRVLEYDIGAETPLEELVPQADVVYHLAGVNRPPDPADFASGNTGLTAQVCDLAVAARRPPTIALSSSIQAELDNPYGLSKREAEEVLREYAERTGATAVAFRLPNVFGKWSRPNYNSAVATFCHNIARGLPITVSDPAREVQLVYIDDVVAAFMALLDDAGACGFRYGSVEPVFRLTLGELVERIETIRRSRESLMLPDLGDPLNRRLLATFNSFLPDDGWSYPLEQRGDPRGVLAEFIKSGSAGQIFISTTKPGIIRGNHYHHTKVEKFLVLTGEGEIRLRMLGTDVIHRVRVSGSELRVVDIPPGWTHCIQNVGDSDMVTLFWSSEVFDPNRPDTYFEEVGRA
jgi:UDP-2-acetamido-2,6-beta-L-arabino-hexul-4-ose reductase